MRRLVLILLPVLLSPLAAHAQCNMPNGPDADMGVIIFNKAHKVMQYCNGDDWIGLWGGGGGSGGGGTPAGAIMAFDLSACPSGWSEYLPARGRFLRGIDNGAGNDPDGTRVAGQTQDDALQNLTGTVEISQMNNTSQVWSGTGIFGRQSGSSRRAPTNSGSNSTAAIVDFDASRVARTANETRPKNVAVLYCRKD